MKIQEFPITLIGLILVVSGLVFGCFGYYLGQYGAIHEGSKTSKLTNNDQDNGWKEYINKLYGFTIDYPIRLAGDDQDWTYGDTEDDVGFGPISSLSGGWRWGIAFYDQDQNTTEDLISRQGNQWSDRKENRLNIIVDDIPAQLVTVTTNQYPDWISQVAYVEHAGKIYTISNGAVARPEFNSFLSSLRFTK